jgi:hypothetical protein
MKTILATILALACCGCVGFGGRRTILAKISVPSLFTFELSTTVNGTYKEGTQSSTDSDTDLVAEPLSGPSEADTPAEPQKPAEPQRPAQPKE